MLAVRMAAVTLVLMNAQQRYDEACNLYADGTTATGEVGSAHGEACSGALCAGCGMQAAAIVAIE